LPFWGKILMGRGGKKLYFSFFPTQGLPIQAGDQGLAKRGKNISIGQRNGSQTRFLGSNYHHWLDHWLPSFLAFKKLWKKFENLFLTRNSKKA
jgi:hypothetical protein